MNEGLGQGSPQTVEFGRAHCSARVGTTCPPRACAFPAHGPLHSIRLYMVRPLAAWYVPPSPAPRLGWCAPPPLTAPPRRFPREKPGPPVLPPPLLQLPKCLPALLRPACPRCPPGPSHCPTMSVGGRCLGDRELRGVAGAGDSGGVASSPGSPWLPLTDGRACAGWRGGSNGGAARQQRLLARAGWHFRSRAPLAVWRQNGRGPSQSLGD